MACLKIGDINIQYDAAITDIDRIAKIIQLNQYLFTNYKGKTLCIGVPVLSNKDAIYIANFDKFFEDSLKKVLQYKDIIRILDDTELLPALYTHLLVEINQNKEANVMFEQHISNDIFWLALACKFFDYKTNFNELANFLKYHKEEKLILNWLKETQRFNTYNYLLKTATNYLQENDFSFFENLNEIISKMNEENINFALSLSNEANTDFPKMSLNELEKLFYGFLNDIKAPKSWKNLYNKLKRKKKILIEKDKNGVDQSQVFIDSDGIRKIKITYDGTIKSFISLVHEFAHFISLLGDEPPFSLLEFNSIYFERVAAQYLINIGYDENIVKQVIRNRKQNNFEIYSSISGILLDISRYNKNGPITREDKIKPLEETMQAIYEIRKQIAEITKESIKDEEFLIMPNCNWQEMVDQECDRCILNFTKNGMLVLNGYQYLIDSYLVDELFEKQDEYTLEKMIFVTENLAKFNIDKIIKMFDIDKSFKTKKKI